MSHGLKDHKRGVVPNGGSGRLKAILYLPIYGACIGLVAAMWQRPGLLAGSLLAIGAAMLYRWNRKSDVVFFVLCALMGSLGEFVAIRFGAWEYSRPWLNIPIWLPLAWGIAGLYLKKTTEVLVPESLDQVRE